MSPANASFIIANEGTLMHDIEISGLSRVIGNVVVRILLNQTVEAGKSIRTKEYSPDLLVMSMFYMN